MVRTVVHRLCIFALTGFFAGAVLLPSRAADDTVLRKIKGNVGYRPTAAAPLVPVSGQLTLADDALAVTQAASQGLVQLPDSSTIGLGADTTVQIGAFKRASTGDGTTITVPTTGGTIRFDIKHPTGAKANYRFVTPTSAIAARGTVGLLSSGANGDTIACLDCADGDVDVTVGTQVYPLKTGQSLTVTLGKVVTIAAVTAVILQSFAGAGLSTSAAAASPVAAGGAAAGAAGAGGAAVGVGAAAAAAVAGVAAASQSKSAPAPSPTASGTGTIQGLRR